MALGNFLQGYTAAQDRNAAAGTRQIQEYGVLQRIIAQQQAAADEQQIKKAIASGGGDAKTTIESLLRSGHPKAIELAQKMQSMLPKPAEPFTLSPGATRFGPDGRQIANVPVTPKAPEPFTLSPGGTRYDATGKQIASSPVAPASSTERPYFSPVQTAKGVYSFNGRTGRMELVQADGKPVVGSASDPRLQGDIAGAKERAKAEATRTFNMSGIGQVLTQAEKLLQGIDPQTGLGQPEPTGSGLGTAVDAVGAFFGYSMEGAPQADQLRAAGAALTSKMPRMEGPQSDRDTQLYREAAGQVGDSKLPRERRLQALKVVRSLWSKYERVNQDVFGGAGGDAPGLTPEEQQELDALRQRFGR